MLISTVQQNELATHIHIFPLFWISFSFGAHRACNGVPFAIHQVLIHHLFYECNE